MSDPLPGIFYDVLGLPPDRFREDLQQRDIEAWDSVLHMSLLLTLEQAYSVSFDPDEGAALTSVPAIRAALSRKRS